MILPELESLVTVGSLKHGKASKRELKMLLNSGRARLRDSTNQDLAIESRFDLAYNAAHALALAALRFHGYRSENRYLVFQALQLTLGIPPSSWRVLVKAHGDRNLMEYEGGGAVDERLVNDLIAAAQVVEKAVRKLMG